MRMRKKKNGKARLEACRELITDSPKISTGDTVYLEIGAGKGGFACEMSRRNPSVKYSAMEKVTDCVVIAAERAKSYNDAGTGLKNLLFINDTAESLVKLFDEMSVDKIFLNFSDPWSKKGYAKRRLTHRRYLSLYFRILKDGGELCFKTDNEGLFDFSLEEIASLGLTPDFVTKDLHSSGIAKDNVVTEYESNFVAMGMKINMLKVTKPIGFMPLLDESLTNDCTERYRRKNEENL